MKYVNEIRAGFVVALLGGVCVAAGPVVEAGSVVRFDTVVGSFDVELFDDETPLHVANFLDYVESGDYDNSLVHRNVTDFVIQGGRFNFDGEDALTPSALPEIASRGTVQNEPGISNTRGTIALAKLQGDPSSGSSEWFINLEDNSSNLDNQNGGFTVFGEVLGDGLQVVDAIAQLPTPQFEFGGSSTTVWNDWPLRNVDSVEQFDAQAATTGFGEDELVIINSITLLADTMSSEDDSETPGTDGDTGGDTGNDSGDGGAVIDMPVGEMPDVMMPGENEQPDAGNGDTGGDDVVPDLPEDPIFTGDGDDGGSADDGEGSGSDNGSGAESVPTPGAFAAGLLGLGVLVGRRRRVTE